MFPKKVKEKMSNDTNAKFAANGSRTKEENLNCEISSGMNMFMASKPLRN